jgi:hypothetical protein
MDLSQHIPGKFGVQRAKTVKILGALMRGHSPGGGIYEGTSLRELRDFLLGCEVYFEVIEEYESRRRIAIVASYLRKEALRQ